MPSFAWHTRGARRRSAFAVPLLALALAATACADAGSRGSAPRSRYEAVTLAGDTVRIGGGAGNDVVLLNVWATWCASCREEFALMDTLLARYRGDGLRVVAVSVDAGDVTPVAQMAREYGVTFEVAHDPDGRVERAFPALGVPASYLVDRDGAVVWRRVGVLTMTETDSAVQAALAKAPKSE